MKKHEIKHEKKPDLKRDKKPDLKSDGTNIGRDLKRD